MTYHEEFRKTYLGAAPHTFVMGLVWLLSGLAPLFFSKTITILFFFMAAGGAFPVGELLRKWLKAPELLSADNKLPGLFPLLGATIPLSFPVIFMAMQHNPNWFFPAFAIIVGGHYLPFIWAYRMPTFGALGGMMIALGMACAYWFPDDFSLAAFLTGGLLLIFAFVHYLMLRPKLKGNQ